MMHEELIAAIGEWLPVMHGAVDRETPLISPGHIDSMALLRLLMWIELKAGRSIDVTAIEIAREWDSVDSIVSFIERVRGDP